MSIQLMGQQTEHIGLEYARRLHALVLDWYRSAESKAQILLTLNGALLAFLTGSLFSRPSDLAQLAATTGMRTRVLLALMCVTLLSSVGFAISCVRSRLLSTRDLERDLAMVRSSPERPYPADILAFFQHLSYLNSSVLAGTLRAADADFELEALSSQIVKLSRNVAEKHRAANRGFVFTGLSLLLFLLAGVSNLHDVQRLTTGVLPTAAAAPTSMPKQSP